MSDEVENSGRGMQYPKHRTSKKQEFCMRVGAERRMLRMEQSRQHKENEGLKALKQYKGEER